MSIMKRIAEMPRGKRKNELMAAFGLENPKKAKVTKTRTKKVVEIDLKFDD